MASHSSFLNDGLGRPDDDGGVLFDLADEVVDSFEFYIRVIAEGGQEYWRPATTVESLCDPDSTSIQASGD